jgi:stage III sporulation protein AG
MLNKKKSVDFFHTFLNKSDKQKITIVVLIGILLLVISLPTKKGTSGTGNTETPSTQAATAESSQNYEEYLENKLDEILAKVDGVGKVNVVVTLKSTEEKVIASDGSYSENTVNETDSSGGVRSSSEKSSSSTNIYHDTSSGNEPFVTMENMPEVEGIIVVAQGGGDGTIASNITSAVEALLDVPAHKIKVLKMS